MRRMFVILMTKKVAFVNSTSSSGLWNILETEAILHYTTLYNNITSDHRGGVEVRHH